MSLLQTLKNLPPLGSELGESCKALEEDGKQVFLLHLLNELRQVPFDLVRHTGLELHHRVGFLVRRKSHVKKEPVR